nr:DUF2812 domain-containing protein [uncultured Oscillibacter sp.]
MKNVTYRWNTFQLYDYRGVEEHLSAMAAQGWRLERVGKCFWRYRRADPSRVHYAVTYNAGASQFNPGPTEGQESLEELCNAAGWTKACDWFQMQIFSTEDPAAVPLETDEALRLQNIHRSMRKNFLPANLVLLLIGLWMSSSLVYSLVSGNILRLFSSNAHLFSGTLFLLVVLLELYTLLHYYHWRKQSRRSIEEGGTCVLINTRAYQRLNRAALVLVGIVSALYLLAELLGGGRGYALFFLAYILQFILLVFLVRRTTAALRKRKASKGVNMAVTLAVDFILAFALIGGLTFCAIRFGWFSGGSGETYTYQNVEFDVHPREDVPLTLSDLTGEPYEHVRRSCRREGSILLPEWSYWETALENGPEEDGWPGSLHLSYTVYIPRFQWFYDDVAEELLEDAVPRSSYGIGYAYVSEDPAPWGAEAVYRRWLDGSPINSWFLCFPDRITSLSMDWEPTAREKALIQSRLGSET